MSSNNQVSFLDVMVYLQDNHLSTSLFCKPFDSHAYLHPMSCHPPHTFNSIVYSQALRVRRICSDINDTDAQLRKLEDHFLKRQYPAEKVRSQIEKAKTIDRSDLLHYKEKKANTRVRFVTTYSPLLKNVGTIFRKHLPILHQSPQLKEIFSEPPLMSFRRPPPQLT